MHLFAFSHEGSPTPVSLENWKVTNRPLQLQMWNGAKAGPVTMKNDCSIETWVTLESVKPHTQQRLCLNFGIPKSKHKRITSNTGSADLRVFQNSGLLQSGSQTNQGLEKTKRFNPKLFLAEPSEFLEKNHAEFLRDCETYCFKAAKTLAKFPRRNLEILFTCLLRVWDLTSATTRRYLPYLDKISLKSPLSQSLFFFITHPPIAL